MLILISNINHNQLGTSVLIILFRMLLERGVWTPAELAVLKVEQSHKLLAQILEREEDLARINGNFSTGFIHELFLPLFQQNLLNLDQDFVEWFLSFSAIFDGFVVCIVLLPIAFVYLCQLLLNGKPPIYQEKGFDDQFHNIPTVPLIFLQQTTLEKVLRRPRRNTIEWYASKFVVRVSDNLLYLNDLAIPIVPPEEVRNPWKSVHIINKFNALYRTSVTKRATLGPEGEARRAKRGSWRSLGRTPQDQLVEPNPGPVENTATVNLLHEAYSTWKENLQTGPASDSTQKTVDEYSVLNHQLMKRVKRPPSRGRSGKSTRKHRMAAEGKRLDKELALNQQDISRMVEKYEEEEQLKKRAKHAGSHHSHAAPAGKFKHRYQAHSSEPGRGQAQTRADADEGTPRTVQFHEHANVRVVRSSHGVYHDRKEPIRTRSPEQLVALQAFLHGRTSKGNN